MLVVDKGDQKMLERLIFVAPPARFPKRVVEGLFELAGETGHRDENSTPDRDKRALPQCHTERPRNQEGAARFIPGLTLEQLFGGRTVAIDPLDMRLDARDFGLEDGDSLVELLDRQRVEVLLEEPGQRIGGVCRVRRCEGPSGESVTAA